MKICLVIFLTLMGMSDIVSEMEHSWIHMKFKSVKCKVLDPSYLNLKKCFVKPISRNVSTLNLAADILKIARGPIYIEARILYKYMTIFRQVHPTITFDFCAVMKGDGFFEKLVELIISFFKDSVPQLFHPCPFLTGYLDVSNITFNVNSLPLDKLIPSGTWKINATIIIGAKRSRAFAFEVQVAILSMMEKL